MTYLFKAEISRPALLDFISRTAEDTFLFYLPPGKEVYGMFFSEETMEYFTNEFPVASLEMVSTQNFREVASIEGCKVWGNPELAVFALG